MAKATDRLAACWTCTTPQPLENGQCEVEGCAGSVVWVDGEHAEPFTETEMALFRTLADRLKGGRIVGERPAVVVKLASASLMDRSVRLQPRECSDLIKLLSGMVRVPRRSDEVRWWADLKREAMAADHPHTEDGGTDE